MADEAKTDEELAAEVAAAAKPAAVDGSGGDLDWGDEGEKPVGSGESEGHPNAVPENENPPAETTVRKLTRYVVLEAVQVKAGTEEGVEMWRRIGEGATFEGPRALDQAHRALGRDHGALVAIPERSWKPKRPVEKPRPPVMEWE